MRSARAAILAAKAYSQDDNSGRNTGSPTKSTALSKEAAKAALCELKDAMPLSKYQGEQAVILIQQLNTTDLELCELGAPKRPILPPNYLTSQWEKIPINERLLALQKYISGFEYNFTNKQYFNVMKNRPLARVMDTAKEIMRRSLPIKCLEAVFLGIYLTAGMTELDRIPVGFKTAVGGHTYRHIVLVIRHRPSKMYGALGLSRRSELMYKELGFTSMSALLADYKQSYEAWWHIVQKVRIGLPVSHDANSTKHVCWRYYAYNVSKSKNWEKLSKDIDNHSERAFSKLYDKWLVTGKKHNDIKREDKKSFSFKTFARSKSPSKTSRRQRSGQNGSDDVQEAKTLNSEQITNSAAVPNNLEPPTYAQALEGSVVSSTRSREDTADNVTSPSRPLHLSSLPLTSRSQPLASETTTHAAEKSSNKQSNGSRSDCSDLDDDSEDSDTDIDD